MRAIYKKLDTETCAWDLDAGCRNIAPNNKRRRKLRKKLRKQLRKKLNKEMINDD